MKSNMTFNNVLYIGMISILIGCSASPRTKRVEAIQKLQEDVEKLKQTKAEKADTTVQADDLKTEVQVLSGKIEETSHGLKSLEASTGKNNQRVDQFTADYDKKILEYEDKLKALETKLTAIEDSLQSKVKKSDTEQADVRMDYSNGMKRFKNKEYGSATTLFTRYIRNFPGGKLVNEARFYLAESFFHKKDFQNAILSYEEYKEKFPKGPHVPESLYKQGLSFVELGKNSDAKLFFSELMNNHSDSAFARKAKIELDKIK